MPCTNTLCQECNNYCKQNFNSNNYNEKFVNNINNDNGNSCPNPTQFIAEMNSTIINNIHQNITYNYSLSCQYKDNVISIKYAMIIQDENKNCAMNFKQELIDKCDERQSCRYNLKSLLTRVSTDCNNNNNNNNKNFQAIIGSFCIPTTQIFEGDKLTEYQNTIPLSNEYIYIIAGIIGFIMISAIILFIACKYCKLHSKCGSCICCIKPPQTGLTKTQSETAQSETAEKTEARPQAHHEPIQTSGTSQNGASVYQQMGLTTDSIRDRGRSTNNPHPRYQPPLGPNGNNMINHQPLPRRHISRNVDLSPNNQPNLHSTHVSFQDPNITPQESTMVVTFPHNRNVRQQSFTGNGIPSHNSKNRPSSSYTQTRYISHNSGDSGSHNKLTQHYNPTIPTTGKCTFIFILFSFFFFFLSSHSVQGYENRIC